MVNKTKVMSTFKKEITVVAGAIIKNNDILLGLRTHDNLEYLNNKWEFPGGKIEKNETKIDALKREFNEELEVNISNLSYIGKITHEYEHFILHMDLYLIDNYNGKPRANVHKELEWVSINDFAELEWAAADIPAYKLLIKYLER